MLNKEREQFQKEQDELLKTILDLRFFLPWQDTVIDDGSLRKDANLEIYITNACNQNCKYCYLTKYPELYPEDKRQPELLLHNLELIYKYILENGMSIPEINFFSGEIWHTQFGRDVLQLSLDYVKKGMQIGWWMITSNCSFIFEEDDMQRIQNYIDEFKYYGSPLIFSISVDGAIVEQESRPVNNGQIRDDKYWDDLFVWAKHNNFFFHPMVAACNVHNWIENHKWWEKKFKEYDYNLNNLMMLEVRNDGWTEENINDYCKFIDYLIDKHLKDTCHNNLHLFYNSIMGIRDVQDASLSGYIPFCFPGTDTFIGCTQATDLTIRLGDLAICPCHRLAYDKYLYGHFTVEDDQITGITANNPQMAIAVLMANFNTTSFKCDTCVYNHYCLKGCRGAQYEALGDPLIPIPNICHFFDRKISFILNKYTELGLIDYLRTVTKYEKDYDHIQQFLQFYDQWKKIKDKE